MRAEKQIRFVDDAHARFGDSGDLRIYHNATNSYIENYTGNLYFQQTVDDGDMIFTCDDGSGGLTAYLTLDGSGVDIDVAVPMVFGTDGTGVDVTFYGDTAGEYMFWDMSSDALRFQDGAKANFGTGQDLSIYHDGSNSSIVNNTGNLTIKNNKDDGDILLQTDNGSGGVTSYITLDGSNVSVNILTQKVIMANLPTSDPVVDGQLWNDNGTLKVSAGE